MSRRRHRDALRRRDLIGLAGGATLVAIGGWTYAGSGDTLRTDVGIVPGDRSPAAGTGRPPAAGWEPPPAASPRRANPNRDPLPDPTIGSRRPAQRTVPAPVRTLDVRRKGFVPTRIEIPAIDVDARVVPVRVDGGVLDVPEDPEVLGWWEDGGIPGNGVGTVVVDGHVDSARHGRGPLSRATRLRPGDTADLSGSSRKSQTYVVRAVRTYRKDVLPAESLFRAGGPEGLVIVTCGGDYRRDRGRWDSNVVVLLELL